MIKTHMQWLRLGPFGGVCNGTLCNRVRQGDGMNLTDAVADVTCAFCLRALARPGMIERLQRDRVRAERE